MKRLCLLLGLAACGSDTNVAGDYTIALTNRTNGCMFGNWNEGDSTTGVDVVFTQSGSDVTATINNVGGLALKAVFGSAGNVFKGDDSIDLKVFGTNSQTKGNCTYTFNGEITADLSGDTLTGRIDYRAADNGNPDCTTQNIHGCDSYQDFNGTRPPQ